MSRISVASTGPYRNLRSSKAPRRAEDRRARRLGSLDGARVLHRRLYPVLWHLYDGCGGGAFGTLAQAAVGAGAQPLLETRASNLLFDEDGRVAGVAYIAVGGSVIAVNAKAVAVCTDGYGENNEMKKEFLSDR